VNKGKRSSYCVGHQPIHSPSTKENIMTTINSPLDISTMGAHSAPAASPSVAPAASPTLAPSGHILDSEASTFAGSTERPSMVAPMNAHDAEQQHLSINRQIAAIDEKLSAQTFDAKTGKPTGFTTAEGSRERTNLELQRQTLNNALQFLGHRALEQLQL
jgi:hypothetical protein